MAQFYPELSVAVLDLALTLFLFRRFPRIEKGAGSRSGGGEGPLVSVIIPARNEVKSLPLLLWDLREQTYRIWKSSVLMTTPRMRPPGSPHPAGPGS